MTDLNLRLLLIGPGILFSTSVSTLWGVINGGLFSITWGSLSLLGLLWVTTGLCRKGELQGSRARS